MLHNNLQFDIQVDYIKKNLQNRIVAMYRGKLYELDILYKKVANIILEKVYNEMASLIH